MKHAYQKGLRTTLYLTLPIASLAYTAPTTASGAYSEPNLETVSVYGKQAGLELQTERDLTPGAVTLLDGATLYQRNISSLADMLRYTPGVWSASNSGTDTMFFSSRGSNLDATNYDMNGIKLLQDGLPVTTADGNNHNRMIDPMSTRYASVARGANALTYGASTLGGAIDFITPTARNSALLELFINGGSHGQLLGRLTTGAVFNEKFDGMITLEAKQWDGYRDHNQQERRGVYANAGWRISDAVNTRLFFTYVDNNQELPGALTAAEVDADRDQASPQAIGGNYQLNVVTSRVASKTIWAIDANSTLDIGFSYEEQTLFHPIVDKILVDFDDAGPNPPVEVFSLLIDTDHREVGGMLRYNLRQGEHNLLAGINYGDSRVEGGNYRNDGGRRNGLTTSIDNAAGSLEAYVVDRWQIASRWTLIYGVQAVSASRDVRNVTVASGNVRSPEDDYSRINPRLGAIYELNENIALFANISRLFEAPTNFELEDDVRGSNATLDAMHGTVAEIGTRGRQSLGTVSHWSWDIALYYAQIRDEILSVDSPTEPGTSLSANVEDTIHAGLEALFSGSLELGGDGSHRIEPLLSITVNDFSFDDNPVYGNNELPAAPGFAVRGEILYRRANGFYAGPTFDIVDERYADFSNTYRLDSYSLLGFRAGYSGKSWQVFAELKNLGDEEYIATHSVRDIAAADVAILNPGEPRSIYVGVQLQF